VERFTPIQEVQYNNMKNYSSFGHPFLLPLSLIIGAMIVDMSFLANAFLPIPIIPATTSRSNMNNYARLFTASSSSSSSASSSNQIATTATTPNPDLDAIQVATLCMDALKLNNPNDALETCFVFSSDRCRAAVGGNLEEFLRYANNPVFSSLVECDDYEIVNTGPVIPGGPHRGEMQTVLISISNKGITIKEAVKASEQLAKKQRPRPTFEERLRQRELAEAAANNNNNNTDDEDDDIIEKEELKDDASRQFLWTLQKERRPPRQDCWLVHEVLFVKNAFSQTL
jgi:hypothetical protein